MQQNTETHSLTWSNVSEIQTPIWGCYFQVAEMLMACSYGKTHFLACNRFNRLEKVLLNQGNKYNLNAGIPWLNLVANLVAYLAHQSCSCLKSCHCQKHAD